MSIMDSLKNMFGGPKTPSEQYAKDVEATHKHMQKVMKSEQNRRDHLNSCRALMKECRTKFNMTIMAERDNAVKKKRSGIPIDREKLRIHEAAIGILTVDMAMFDLNSISSESDLNRAMNNMGKALRQMIRLDNNTSSISSTARNFIDMFYPSFKSMVDDSENYTAVKKAKESAKKGQATDVTSIYEIPEEIRARINETFVENLLAGDSFEMAMYKAQHQKHGEDMNSISHSGGLSDTDWDMINRLADQPDDDGIVKHGNSDSNG